MPAEQQPPHRSVQEVLGSLGKKVEGINKNLQRTFPARGTTPWRDDDKSQSDQPKQESK